MILLSYKDICKLMEELGIDRFRVIQLNPGKVVIEVPIRHIFVLNLLRHIINEIKPISIGYSVKTLDWWRCWFKKQQFIIKSFDGNL